MNAIPELSIKKAALAAFATALAASSAQALTYTGNAPGDATNWADADNWDGTNYVGDGTAGGDSAAFIPGVTSGNRTVNLSDSLSDVTVGGNTFRIDAGQGVSNTTVNVLSGGVFNATLGNSLLTINEGGGNNSGNSANLNVNGGTVTVGQIRLARDSDGGTSRLSVTNGGTLTMSGGGQFEFRTDAGLNSTAIFEVNGGTFNATAGNRSLLLGAGNSQVLIGGNATFNAGGNNGLSYTASHANADGATALLQLTGSSIVQADFDNVNAFSNAANLTGSSTIQFVSDAGGLSTLNVDNNLDLIGDGSQNDASLIVDLSLYTGSETEFDLITFGTISGTFANVQVIGSTLDSITYDGNTVSISVVPEPGTYALLAGLAGLTFVMTRRRK